MITHIVDGLEAGDCLDIDLLETEHGPVFRKRLLEEIQARGLVMNGNLVGAVEICGVCDGECDDGKKPCRACDACGCVVDFGRGKKPYRE